MLKRRDEMKEARRKRDLQGEGRMRKEKCRKRQKTVVDCKKKTVRKIKKRTDRKIRGMRGEKRRKRKTQ